MKLSGEQLQVKYLVLDQVEIWDDNPKKHDEPALIASILKYGYVGPAKYEPHLKNGKGGLVYGNGRSICLKMIHDDPQYDAVPRGVAVDSDGNWHVPVLFGVDAESEETAKAFAIDHNNLTMAGGDFDLWDVAKMWETDDYVSVLRSLQETETLPLTMDNDDVASFLDMIANGVEGREFDESLADDVELEAVFKIRIAVDDADALEAALDKVVADFDGAKLERLCNCFLTGSTGFTGFFYPVDPVNPVKGDSI